MRKFLIIFIVIVGIIMIFAFPRYAVTDYYGYDNMGADYLVRKPYRSLEYNTNQTPPVTVSVYSDLYNSTIPIIFYKFFLIKSDEYIYYIELDSEKFARHVFNSLENHLAFISLDFSQVGTLYCFLRDDPLIGYEIADDSYSISQGLTGLLQNDGFRPYRLTNSDGSFYTSGTQLVDRSTKLAYDYFLGHIKYEFILDKQITDNQSPFGSFTLGIDSFRSVARNFYKYYLLFNVGEFDSYTWFKGITTDIESLGPMPVLPDTETLSGIDLVAAYFSWVINEVVYVIKFGTVVLRGIL